MFYTFLLSFSPAGYDKTQRVSNSTVRFIWDFLALSGFDERNGQITTHSVLHIFWTDERFVFTPVNGIAEVTILSSLIWKPDLAIINSAASDSYIQYDKQHLTSVNAAGGVINEYFK